MPVSKVEGSWICYQVNVIQHLPTCIMIMYCNPLRITGSKDIISPRVFSSLAIDDIFETSIVQQCRMLESRLDTCVLAKCLSDPMNAPDIIKRTKEEKMKVVSSLAVRFQDF